MLLAEYGARIEYRRGRNNIRADMPSIFDTGEWVDPRDITEPEIRELLPLLYDDLDLTIVSQANKRNSVIFGQGGTLKMRTMTLFGALFTVTRLPRSMVLVTPVLYYPCSLWRP